MINVLTHSWLCFYSSSEMFVLVQKLLFRVLLFVLMKLKSHGNSFVLLTGGDCFYRSDLIVWSKFAECGNMNLSSILILSLIIVLLLSITMTSVNNVII